MPAGLLPLVRGFTTANGVSRPVLTGVPSFGGGLLGSEAFAAGRPCLLRINRDRDGASGAINGTVAFWGADLPNPDMVQAAGAVPGFTPACQRFTGDGVATNYDSTIPFVAVANYNWIALIFRGDRATKTGTATTTVGSADVTGAGTAFDTEFWPGATIVLNGESQTVAEITSATRMSTVAPWTGANAAVAITGNVYPVPAYTTDYTVVTNGGLARLTLAAASRAPAGSRIELHYVKPIQMLADGTHTLEATQVRSRSIVWCASTGATISGTNAWLERITL